MVLFSLISMKIEQFELQPKVPRPTGYMDNNYIGDDGKDYHSTDALRAANEAHFRQTHFYISSVLGRKYASTDEGHVQMQRDESAHWDAQKIDVNRGRVLEPIKPSLKFS